jgi:hypothetical protein
MTTVPLWPGAYGNAALHDQADAAAREQRAEAAKFAAGGVNYTYRQ